MRIVIDLDGVICELKKENQTYLDVEPLKGAVEDIKKLKGEGHYIIINTARHMLTTQSNLGLVKRKVAKDTLDWLEKYGIEYDEIYFGKPYGNVYIDDNALEFYGWNTINDEMLNTEKINIVIPMAGAGSRFQKAGFKEPKPLIKVKDRYMFELAVDSFSPIFEKFSYELIFIIQKEHAQEFNMRNIILEKHPNSKIIELDSLTQGQAQSVLYAKKYINNLNKLLIFNSDSYCLDEELIECISNHKVEGVISCFHSPSDDERYSFAKVDEHNYVVQVTEKVKISDWASTGMYYFSKGRDFVRLCEEMIEQEETEKGEFYVMPLYTKMIELGKRVKKTQVKKYNIFGTPEELEEYLMKNE